MIRQVARSKRIGYGPFKSWDEFYFKAWCDELGRTGYLQKWAYEPYPFILTDGLYNRYTVEEKLKTKIKFVDKQQVILEPRSYTPDFIIFWRDELKGRLYQILNEGKKIETMFIAHQEDEACFSIVEIKPSFDRHNMTRLFVNNQKDVWEKYEKFVNLIKIEDLFKATFTPKIYLKTPTGKKRIPKWKPKTINQFISEAV